MAKGGRYLNTNKGKNTASAEKPAKKKGKGWKIFLSVLLVLALLIGAGLFVANRYLDSMLGKITQAEYEVKNEDKTYEELMAEIMAGRDSEE